MIKYYRIFRVRMIDANDSYPSKIEIIDDRFNRVVKYRATSLDLEKQAMDIFRETGIDICGYSEDNPKWIAFLTENMGTRLP